MPKEITHWLLAERALASLPRDSGLKRLCTRHKGAYLGGAVLPDTLAHIFRGPFHPTARTLGRRFHDPSSNSYQPLIRAELQFPEGLPPGLLACFLGVLCHLEADAALHPFVYSVSGHAGIGGHYRVETEIDLHFLRRGEFPGERRLDRILLAPDRELLARAAGLLFDPEGELPQRALEQALALHSRFQAMYDRTFWKLAVRLLARTCGSPFREQQHLFYPLRVSGMGTIGGGDRIGWRHPESGKLRRESIDDLAREAVERCTHQFRRIEAAGSLSVALGDPPGANLLTGLHGVTKSGE